MAQTSLCTLGLQPGFTCNDTTVHIAPEARRKDSNSFLLMSFWILFVFVISLCLFPDGSISWMRDCAGLVQGIMQTKVSWRLDHSYLQVNK